MERAGGRKEDSIHCNNYGFYHKKQELNHSEPFASPDRHDSLGF
jgi:hypothetical protein